MPEVAFTTEMRLPLSTVWAFVSDMNNWAPFLTGYQSHQIIDATDSLWTLKGEVGILSRRVELRAHVTEWVEPQRVSFTLTGVNEDVDGGGTMILRRVGLDGGDPQTPGPAGLDGGDTPATAPVLTTVAPRAGLLRRVLGALARFLFRLTHRSEPSRALLVSGATYATGEGVALEFTLRMDAGGPAAPLVNAMLGPALEPAVEDLAKKIAAYLEESALAQGQRAHAH
jgi:carbon monoxide dehydrogenase subunit G